MSEISILGNILVINDIEVHLKYKIKEFIQINNVVIVRLKVACRDDDVNNIYGIINGKIAWRVQDMMEYNVNCEPFVPDPYSGIDVYEKDPNLIVGTTSYGFRMLINPLHGKIVGEDGWTK